MSMKASEVGAWLRQMAGKRDHREALRDDYRVLRPGPNFDWFMAGLAASTTPAAPRTRPGRQRQARRQPALGNFHRRIGPAVSALSAVR